ncbi:hypothetical protein AAHE18_09G055500 [Arachis hypogaea]|nr:uncharacterized protein DS421_9g262050 [Arachis hypogaea]
MAKNNIVHAIAMLIVGAIICSTITKFHDETTSKESWTTSYNVVRTLDGCIRKCKASFKRRTIERTECIKECVVVECRRRHPIFKKKRSVCFDSLFKLIMSN